MFAGIKGKPMAAMAAISLLIIIFAGAPAIAAEKGLDGLSEGEAVRTEIITEKVSTYFGVTAMELGLPEGEEIDKLVGYMNIKRAKGDLDLEAPMYYRIDGRTIVVDTNGRETDVNGLTVPCRAEVYFYENRRKAPVVYRIVVKALYKGASKEWTPSQRD